MITTREQWLARRRAGIGGSDAPVIVLGRVFGTTAEDLRLEKAGLVVPPDIGQSEDVRRGAALEDDALAEFMALTGVPVRFPASDMDRWNEFWFEHPQYPWAFANLDAYTIDDRGDPVEVKCSRASKWARIREEGLPDYWIIQGMHQLWVANAQRVHFWVFNADAWRGLHIVLERDEALIAQIVAAELAFRAHLAAGTSIPAPAAPGEALARIGGMTTALDVSASGDWCALFDLYRAADERARAADEERARILGLISDLVEELGVDGVHCGEARAKIVRRSGSEKLDRARLAAAHPELNLRPYLQVTAGSESLQVRFSNRPRGGQGKGRRS